MKRTTTHMKRKGAGFAIALALLAPAAAHATATGDRGPAVTVRNPVSLGGATVARSSGPVRFRPVEGAGGRVVQRQTATVTRKAGLGWHEAAIGAGIVIGILLFGLWGDVAVGTSILVVGTLLDAGAVLLARAPWAARQTALRLQPRWLDGAWGRRSKLRGTSGPERSVTR